MPTMNLLDAKTSGAETEIIIARNGKLAVGLVPIGNKMVEVRLGLAKGKFEVPDDIDGANEIILEMFGLA